MAAPLAASMRFRAMEPEASTQKMMRQPAGRAMRLVRTSSFSMNTFARGWGGWLWRSRDRPTGVDALTRPPSPPPLSQQRRMTGNGRHQRLVWLGHKQWKVQR